MSSATSGSVSCEVRQAEIELRMYDSCPAARPWLLDAAFQEKTSGVIASRYNRAMKSTASTACGELITTCSFSSWIEAPNDQSKARPAMFESISCDIPTPS